MAHATDGTRAGLRWLAVAVVLLATGGTTDAAHRAGRGSGPERGVAPAARDDAETDRALEEAMDMAVPEIVLLRCPRFRVRRHGVESGPADGCASGAPTPPVHPFFPRGDVRARDLDAFALQVDVESALPSARIEFRRDGVLLAAIDGFDPPHRNTWEAIPEAVRVAVRPGDVVTWGWYPDAGSERPIPAELRFRVVGDDPAGAGSGRDGSPGLPARWRGLARVAALRRRGLETAAFREAYALAHDDPDDRRAWGALLAFVEDWGGEPTEFRRALARRLLGDGGVPALEPPVPRRPRRSRGDVGGAPRGPRALRREHGQT